MAALHLSIIDFNADPTGTQKSTSALQTAIDTAAEAGGGTVLVPPGRYVTGTIRFRSNIRLHLELGATLVGSPDIDDYTEEDEGHIPPEFPFVRCLFVGFDLENVEVTGGGTIDGSGAAYMDYSTPTFDETFTPQALEAMPDDRSAEYVSEHKKKRPTWIFFFRRCRNIKFRDFRIVDVVRWTTRFSQCENTIISGLVIENDLRAANCDGMHFTSCRNTVISDCTITSGDDCIAITTYGDSEAPSIGTVITNCVLTSHSAGIRLGLGKGELLEDVTISNCVLRNCNRAVGIFASPGATVRRVSVSNLQISTRLIAGTWWGKAEPLMITTLGPDARIEEISISNISATAEQGIVICAVPDSVVSDIRLSNVRLRLTAGPMSRFSAGTVDIRPHSMERRQLAAIYAHGVESLSIRETDIRIDNDAREFFPNAIELTECRNLEIGGLREHPAG